jgi:hypothetical protein
MCRKTVPLRRRSAFARDKRIAETEELCDNVGFGTTMM